VWDLGTRDVGVWSVCVEGVSFDGFRRGRARKEREARHSSKAESKTSIRKESSPGGDARREGGKWREEKKWGAGTAGHGTDPSLERRRARSRANG